MSHLKSVPVGTVIPYAGEVRTLSGLRVGGVAPEKPVSGIALNHDEDDVDPDIEFDIEHGPKCLWLLCDGSTLPISGPKMVRFKEVLGSGFGNEPDNNIHLPDLRGMFLRGARNHGLERYKQGVQEGRGVGGYQKDSFKNHDHTVHGKGALPGIGSGNGDIMGSNNGPDVQSSLNTGRAGEDETRPQNASVNFLIRVL